VGRGGVKVLPMWCWLLELAVVAHCWVEGQAEVAHCLGQALDCWSEQLQGRRGTQTHVMLLITMFASSVKVHCDTYGVPGSYSITLTS